MYNYISSVNIKEDTRVFIVGVKDNQEDEHLSTIIKRLSLKEDFTSFGEITPFYPLNDFNFNRIVFIGLGDKEKYDLTDIQKIASKIAKEIDHDVVIDLASFLSLNSDAHYLAEKLVETIELVNYKFNNYKTNKKDNNDYQVNIYYKDDISKAINSGYINADSTNHARNLVNEPRNKMTPSILAKYAEDLAHKYNLGCKIYNKEEIEKLGMGAFLAVNKGSKEEAKLIHLQYRNGNGNITTLIGKGLTYDSGGYCIKPKDGMAGMKTDMAGAASVLGAIELIARKKLTVDVDVVIAATENLISNEAVVPDDIVTTMSGKTIEILNTDAEGRLTLVDAVTFAKTHNAQRIIDVATLTGGVVTALGKEITGAFTNNKAFLDEFKEKAQYTGESIWELPVDPFRERCKKSTVADYNNSPGRDGHASFGAALIAEFAEDTPWIHLDIAGTSDKNSDYLLGPEGATGVMVRTLARLFE
ncbi:MAG TPA: leucyl aminopeptidase [Haloplasmataceae bacterium]